MQQLRTVLHDEGPSNICRGNDGRLATCTAKAARSAALGCTCCRADAKLVCVVPDRTAMRCGPTSGMAAPCCGHEPARPIACAGACGAQKDRVHAHLLAYAYGQGFF